MPSADMRNTRGGTHLEWRVGAVKGSVSGMLGTGDRSGLFVKYLGSGEGSIANQLYGLRHEA